MQYFLCHTTETIWLINLPMQICRQSYSPLEACVLKEILVRPIVCFRPLFNGKAHRRLRMPTEAYVCVNSISRREPLRVKILFPPSHLPLLTPRYFKAGTSKIWLSSKEKRVSSFHWFSSGFFCYVGRQTDKTGAQVANASLAQILSKDVVRNFHSWVLVGFLNLKMLRSQIDGCYLNSNLKIEGCYSTHSTRSNDIPVLRCSLLLLLLLLQKRNDQLVSVSQACFALFGAGLSCARASVSLFCTIVL